jgi:MFS family permease
VPLPRALAPFSYRNFTLNWVGHTVSNTGRWIELTGAVWLVSDLTTSPFLLGLLGIARAVPSILLSPIAGVVADRVDQRRLLVITQSTSMGASFLLWWSITSSSVTLPQVYLLVAVQSAITAFDASTRNALFPRLVPRTVLMEAVTLQTTAARASQFIGPLVGGLAIATYGNAAPFALNCVSSLALVAAILLMRGVVARTAAEGSSFRGEFVEGLRLIHATPVLTTVLVMEVLYGLFALNPVLVTIVARDTLGVGPGALGGLLSAPALGALGGIAILIVKGQPRRQGRFVVVCSLAYAAVLGTLAFAHEYGAAFVIFLTLGLLDVLMTVTRQSVVQFAAPGRMRGRVTANIATVTRGTGPLSQTQSGILAGAFGASMAVVASSAILGVGFVMIARANRAYWRLLRDDRRTEALEDG